MLTLFRHLWESKAFYLLSAAGLGMALAASASEGVRYERHFDQEGISVDVAVESLVPGAETFREDDEVRVRFTVTDTATGARLGGLYPAAWMDRLPTEDRTLDGPNACEDKVAGFIGGSLLAVPELDMNVYYVLALNDDATISVVDPLFGFGGSKLLDMIFLESPGEDWALTADGNRLFVTMPEAGKVAVVDLTTWRVIQNVETRRDPRRVALQDDGHYLWVTHGRPGAGEELSGVTVVDTTTLEPVAYVATGRGRHSLAFSQDNLFTFVTNSADGTVSIIDARTLKKSTDVLTGSEPVSIAYSSVARAAYVSHRGGNVAVVDAKRGKLVAIVETEPGLGEIRFTPDERLALVVHPEENLLHVVDAATNRIVQTGDMMSEPDQVAFTDELAYVRHRGSDQVLMIPLAELGRAGTPVPVIELPGGQHPPGEMTRPTPAAGIVQAPGATAVLVSNPGDGVIYYYKEGMAAPMGHFKNYGRAPRAVQVVDRSLRETATGVYETTAQLRRSGTYDLAFYLDTPTLTRCFPLEVAVNPEIEAAELASRPVAVEILENADEVGVGEEVALRFRLTHPESGEPRSDLTDLVGLTILSPGTWHRRHPAKALGDGVYEVRFEPPEGGVYYVFLESLSIGLRARDWSLVTLEAKNNPTS